MISQLTKQTRSFVGTGIILNILSFAIPAAVLLARRRSERYHPSNRYFKMPGIVGWVANFFAVAWPVIGAISYSWPTVYPVGSPVFPPLSSMLDADFVDFIGHQLKHE